MREHKDSRCFDSKQKYFNSQTVNGNSLSFFNAGKKKVV